MQSVQSATICCMNNENDTFAERLLSAQTPEQVREIARGIGPRQGPTTAQSGTAAARDDEPADEGSGPGPSDGGTTTVPTPVVNLATEDDPAKVRAVARAMEMNRR